MMRLAVILAVVLVGCDPAAEPTPEPTPETATISGTFTLHHERGWVAGSSCRGSDGYDDIMAGMQVTLRDEEGTVLATDTFGVGSAPDSEDRLSPECVFEFAFTDVPDVSFYTITTGRRGEVTYSRSDLEAMNWTVALSIGN